LDLKLEGWWKILVHSAYKNANEKESKSQLTLIWHPSVSSTVLLGVSLRHPKILYIGVISTVGWAQTPGRNYLGCGLPYDYLISWVLINYNYWGILRL